MTYVGSLSIVPQVVNHHTLVFLTLCISFFKNLKCLELVYFSTTRQINEQPISNTKYLQMTERDHQTHQTQFHNTLFSDVVSEEGPI